MESLIYNLFVHNWQRKLLALATALILWFFVSHSITETKMIRNVPIRISNLPADKTIVGLLSNGLLNKKINLTLTGSKDIIEEIETGDFEVHVDASIIDHPDWALQITKKNLVSLNPAIDLAKNINSVTHSEFVIKLNRLVTAKVTLNILPPIGESPPGYEFLDIWPQKLMQTVSGPEEEINRLKAKGLELTFNLDEITKAELDSLKPTHENNNEVSFFVPYDWKQISIPFRSYNIEEINDPDAQNLRVDFLRQEFLSIESPVPVHVFYPLKNLTSINPTTVTLVKGDQLIKKEDTLIFARPLYVKNVSRLFLSIIRDYLEIVIVAEPKEGGETLPWGLEVITPAYLEEIYLAKRMAMAGTQISTPLLKKRELLYRNRFRSFLQNLVLYISPDHKLNIESTINNQQIIITDY
jgi:hypothetical protein